MGDLTAAQTARRTRGVTTRLSEVVAFLRRDPDAATPQVQALIADLSRWTGPAPLNFDHSAVSVLEEYGALRQALNDLGLELDRQPTELLPGGRPAWLRMVVEAARTSRMADTCRSCRATMPDDRTMYWPIVAEATSPDWVVGTYRCFGDHVWTCGFSTERAGG